MQLDTTSSTGSVYVKSSSGGITLDTSSYTAASTMGVITIKSSNGGIQLDTITSNGSAAASPIKLRSGSAGVTVETTSGKFNLTSVPNSFIMDPSSGLNISILSTSGKAFTTVGSTNPNTQTIDPNQGYSASVRTGAYFPPFASSKSLRRTACAHYCFVIVGQFTVSVGAVTFNTFTMDPTSGWSNIVQTGTQHNTRTLQLLCAD